MDTNVNPLDELPQNEWDAIILSVITPLLPLCAMDTLITIEDLQQEAWTGLLTACERYDAKRAKFTTFAYTYIRGYVMQYITKTTRNKPYQIQTEEESELDLHEYEDSTAERRDLIDTIFDLVSDEEHSHLLREHFIKNKSFRQISREIGVSHVTVANRVNKLLDILEQRLSHENVNHT